MVRPTWATVVGTIGIILASFGILGSINSIATPFFISFQKEMFSTMQENIDRIDKDDAPVELFNLFSKAWDIPGWWRVWLIIGGMIALVMAAFLLTASIMLLQTKQSAVIIFYWSAGLTIGFNLVGTIAALMTNSLLAMGKAVGYLFGLVVAVVLLIVAATGDKHAFVGAPAEPKKLRKKGG